MTKPEGTTYMSECPRCTGKDGAHYMECVIGRLFERLLGPEYPWKAPVTPVKAPETHVPVMPRGFERHTEEALQEAARALAEQRLEAADQATALAQAQLVREAEASVRLDGSTHSVPDEYATSEPEPVERKKKKRGTTFEDVKAAVELFADQCLILGENGPTDTPFSQRRDWVPAYALLEKYEEWRTEQDADLPRLVFRTLGVGMTALGYKSRQAIDIGGTRPALYFGVTLRPKINWGQPRASETADDKEDHATGSIRSLMQQARTATPEASTPTTTTVVESPPEPEPSNNGWNKTWTSEQLSHVTIEDAPAVADTAPKERRYRYDGPRPGRELPRDYREMIVEPLLEIPGWSYAPTNSNGKGKPRITNPKGQVYTLANTPSDWRGLQNCKSHLKTRLGAPL